MIAGLLLLAPAGLGLLALGASFLSGAWRARALGVLCFLGFGFGMALVVANGSLEQWRGAEIGGVATVAGTAIACAWLVAAVVAAPAGRALSCALVGIASSAMALAVTSEWVVPALLFWLCSSLAVAGLAAQARSGPWVWVLLFASDAALVAALLGNWIDTRSWLLPEALDGWSFYVLILAAVLRAGVVPLSGTWSLLGGGAPAIPLLVGGAFCILRVGLGEGDPWPGVVLFVASLGISLAIVLVRRPWGGMAAATAASIATLLGLAVIAPAAIPAAGAAAAIAGATAALWLVAREEAAPERVVCLVALPPTLGFVAAVIGVAAALGETVVAEEVVDKVPWTLALVAAPLALTGNLVVATRLATTLQTAPGWFGRLRSWDVGALAVGATRLLLLLSVAAAVIPGEWIGVESGLISWDERRALWFGIALVVAGAAAWFGVRRVAPAPPGRPPSVPFDAWARLETPPSGTIAARALTAAALVLAVAAIGAVGWLTFEGLRLGFL